jgi:GT2 family glycosyltransferase
MDPTNPPARSSPERIAERAAELDQLIKAFRIAQENGERADALRIIDRAWRIAPVNGEINQLYGLFLLSEGHTGRAIELLDFAAADNAIPDIEATRISALLSDGQLPIARQRLEAALDRFAVKPGETLARVARQLATASVPEISGWVGIGADLAIQGEITSIESSVQLEITTKSGTVVEHWVGCKDDQTYTAFTFPIPRDNNAPRIRISANGHRLLGENLAFPPDFGFDGQITSYADAISGWVSLGWNPDWPLRLHVSNQSGFATDLAATRDPTHANRHLFTLAPNVVRKAGNVFSITAEMPDGGAAAMPGSPFMLKPAPIASPRKRPKSHDAPSDAIDIIIPVYSGMPETLACIRSVQRTTAGMQREIVVVDDAAIDPRIGPALDALSNAGVITLIRNTRNLGFPASVNHGLELHADRDVVILNADTEVYDDWLARLRTAAYRSDRTGTVTPLTNSGTIASYPASEEPALNSRLAAERDKLAAEVNRGIAIDIPTGVGFCLYIRRDCLDSVGNLDAATFAAGYGEENDFCLRASAAGWRHLLAGDVYVSHVGGRSFGGRRARLFERNIRLLNLRHPGYDANIQAFIARNPAHPMRRRLDEARLRDAGGPSVLLVNIGRGGGVDRAVQDRAIQIRAEGLKPIVVKPDVDHDGRWTVIGDEAKFDDLYYDGPGEVDAFFTLLSGLKLDHIEIHHFLDLPGSLIDRLFEVGPPVDIHVHDYVWYCPRINLLDGTNRYCGEPAPIACQACIDRNGTELREDISVAALRLRSTRWLASARRLTAPTPSVAARMRAQFPDLNFQIVPLEAPIDPAPIARAPGKRRKVALIGAIGFHKGYDVLLEMARVTVKRDLPLDFVVIGYTVNDRALFETGRVFVTGEYRETELEQLIAREKPDMALFLSQFPESWCFALTHAVNAKVPVGGFIFGAIADRLGTLSPKSLLFPLSTTAAELCDLLVSNFENPPHQDDVPAPSQGQDTTSAVGGKPAIVIRTFTPPESAKISRKNMATQGISPTASVDFLPLTKGMFLFSVRPSTTPSRVDAGSGLVLPATQLSTIPGSAPGQVEFLLGPDTANTWLTKPGDQIIVKVAVPSAVLLITSVAIDGIAAIELDIARLDRPQDAIAPVHSPRIAPPLPATQKSLKLTIVTHIQNRGDTTFSEAEWAGTVGEPLWIESFSVLPLEGITPGMIEYKGITATGVETPWVSGGGSCGTRGIGVPLTAFAIRGKPQAGATNIVCEYGAILLSGTVIGPARNGAPCRSDNPNDPINGIWVSISGTPDTTTATTTPKGEPDLQTPPETPPAAKKTKHPVGPQFSALREPG